MKKFLVISLLAFFISDSFAQKLTAYFSQSTFHQANGSSFIETYLSVNGNTVKFLPNANQKLQSKIEIQWVLKSGDNIVYFDKYNLLSPELSNDQAGRPNFLDQHRIPVNNGTYTLELAILDKNAETTPYRMKQDVKVDYPNDKLSISDIELLESFTKASDEDKFNKSGFRLIPFVNNFYSQELNTVKFYAELYNSNKNPAEDFLVRYYIINDGNKQFEGELSGMKKMQPQAVNVLLAEFPLDKVSSGNYSVIIEARNKTNELLARKSVNFQRSRPNSVLSSVPSDYTTIDFSNTFVATMPDDSMKEYIASLYPVAAPNEKITIDNLSGRDANTMKKYLYSFWSRRDAQNPEQKWLEYKKQVDKVNANYSTFNHKGYETDRGRVYLQYGEPNTIDESKWEPNKRPYEIWQYYVIGNQTNRKFVFYQPALASNNFILLHSDVIGEVSAYDWTSTLYQDAAPERGINGSSLDDRPSQSSFGDKLNDNYTNPK